MRSERVRLGASSHATTLAFLVSPSVFFFYLSYHYSINIMKKAQNRESLSTHTTRGTLTPLETKQTPLPFFAPKMVIFEASQKA
jgi:hypothetical protein